VLVFIEEFYFLVRVDIKRSLENETHIFSDDRIRASDDIFGM
jgi:hypothetical protein